MANLSTYQPLYGKYRPQQFADVVGQEAIIQTLQNAITGNQLAHAYLFCGPRGTGKTSTARILAKSINCQNGPTLTPCQTCATCTGITHGNGLDVVEIDAASHSGVDHIRDLMETCQFSPMMGKYKIYIIDEVHMLSTSAFNALLKTLEEPPSHVIFIFATTEAHKVLPTIISRCQRYDFSRIRVQDLVPHLGKVAQAESIQIQDDAILAIARHARGGLRDALSLLDQVGVLSKTQANYTITLTDVTRFLGGLSDENLIALLSAIQQQNIGELLACLDKHQQEGIEPRVMIQGLTQAYRNLMLIHACADQPAETLLPLLGISEPVLQQLQPLANGYAAEEYPQILSQLTELNTRIRYQANPQLWLETGLTQLAFKNQLHTLQALAERVALLENGSAPAAPTRVATAAAPTTVATTTPTPLPTMAPAAPAPTMPPTTVLPSTPAAAPQTLPTGGINPTLPNAPTAPPSVSMPMPPSSGSVSAGNVSWEQVLEHITNTPTKMLAAQQACLIGIEGQVAIVGCRSQAILNTLKNPKKLAALQEAFTSASGTTMDVRLEIAEGGIAPAGFSPATTAETTLSQPQPTLAEPLPVTTPATLTASPTSAEHAPEAETHIEPHAAAYQGATPPPPSALPSSVSHPQGQSPAAMDDDLTQEWAEAKQHVAQLLQGKPL